MTTFLFHIPVCWDVWTTKKLHFLLSLGKNLKLTLL